MTTLSMFHSLRTVGTVLPAEALTRAVDLSMPGQSTEDYQFTPGMTINAAAARAWDAALGAHRAWKSALERLPDGDPAIKLTRERWLLPLLYELGYGRPEPLPAGMDLPPGLGETETIHFPLSHRVIWPSGSRDVAAGVPLHLVGGGVALDSRTPGVTARAPQSMMQDLLNRARPYLWGIVSNGRILRILRDASSLTKQSYVEFDLDDIFENQRYADFRLFFLTVHASRLTPIATAASLPSGDDTDEEATALVPDSCWLEQWRTAAIADGARALDALREGVAAALTHLGTGFVSHPNNHELIATLADSPDAAKDLHRALLRIAYRLIVLFVAEDRDLLHTASTDIDGQARYTQYFSTTRLRQLATTRTGTRHTDLWDAHLIVTDALAGDGLDALALPGLGATLFARDSLGVLADAALPNRSLLAAVRSLAQITDPNTGVLRPVDYRNLDSEELGGVYEGLLAYSPRYDCAARTFSLEVAAGNDRKKSGSYYTPSGLIALVLDEALDPLIREARRAAEPEAALLAITVVDPAVGSGHFVVAAARRIASELAAVRTGDAEPTPAAVRTANADVIERCIYGVDLNDLAIEITKVALWLEAFDGTRPFPFLDGHLKVGNALLGTTPALLRDNIPDAAFRALTGDDGSWTTQLKARNKAERTRGASQLGIFDSEILDVETTALTERARKLDEARTTTLIQARTRADAWRRFEHDPDLATRKFTADAWCAAFVQPKTKDAGQGITYDTLRRIAKNPGTVPSQVLATVRDLARQYRFFHWHLEFPAIFTVPEPGTVDVDPATGWHGGFSCVVGNPPWERVKLQDKEFFAAVGRADITEAKTASIRERMIGDIADEDPPLYATYRSALRTTDAVTHLLRASNRYPLTGHGDVNTYSVFAETFRTILAVDGAAGFITPTGLATDKTTAPFFADLIAKRSLSALHDFVTNTHIWQSIGHGKFRFSITTIRGSHTAVEQIRMSFLNKDPADTAGNHVFMVSPTEINLVNPNTGTLPMFRTRADADITLGIYRRHPVLVCESGSNPWQLTFGSQFHMTNDSGLFRQNADLADGEFNGWSYHRQGQEYLPLYEAKLVWFFDHRLSSYSLRAPRSRDTELPRLTDEMHDDPQLEPLALYWVARSAVSKQLKGRWNREWMLGWRSITSPGNERTFVPSVLPTSGLGNSFVLAFPAEPTHGPLLHAAWSSLAFDYVVRQKLSGSNVNFFVLKQLACPAPSTFAEPAPWQSSNSLAAWVLPYVLELSYTSWRLQAYAQDMHDGGPPFRWDPERRVLLRADLDAAFLHVYGLTRPEAKHVLDSFPVIRKYEERDHGEYRTRQLVLDAYDRMNEAAGGGASWTPLAGLPAGQGPRHKRR